PFLSNSPRCPIVNPSATAEHYNDRNVQLLPPRPTWRPRLTHATEVLDGEGGGFVGGTGRSPHESEHGRRSPPASVRRVRSPAGTPRRRRRGSSCRPRPPCSSRSSPCSSASR